MATPAMKTLSADQVQVIQSTWKIPNADPEKYGQIIFQAFFEKFPQHKSVFPKFKDIAVGSLIGNPAFASHAVKIMKVFDDAVSALSGGDAVKVVGKQVAGLASYHIQRSLTNKAAFVDIRGVITDALVDVCKLDNSGKQAWSDFLDIFYHVLFSCFDGNSAAFQ